MRPGELEGGLEDRLQNLKIGEADKTRARFFKFKISFICLKGQFHKIVWTLNEQAPTWPRSGISLFCNKNTAATRRAGQIAI